MSASHPDDRRLHRSHGYLVVAHDTEVGTVETPLYPVSARDPDFLVVRTAEEIPGTFRVLPASFVEAVDEERRTVTLWIEADDIRSLPERLPLRRSGETWSTPDASIELR